MVPELHCKWLYRAEFYFKKSIWVEELGTFIGTQSFSPLGIVFLIGFYRFWQLLNLLMQSSVLQRC